VEIPLGMMVAVTGVSGSGKSTLVHDVIYRSLEALHKRATAEAADAPGDDGRAERSPPALTCRKIEGAERRSTTVMIDQSPIGRTPRSNPVTYIKAFDIIRASSPPPAKPKSAATPPAISPSTFPAAAAKPARATAR
jgi:excinuclease ABC subunit A